MRTFGHPATRKLALAGAVAAAGLLLAACGTDDSASSGAHHGETTTSASPSRSATTAGSAAPGAFNDADVTFAQLMIPHHQQALEMAGLADGRAEDTELKKLAVGIEKAQGPEIEKMKAWLKSWGRPESAGHNGHGMAGMMSEQDMKALAAAKGKAFDRKFTELMIAHHEGAVEMAEAERKNGRDETAKKLAHDVVRTQSAEVAQLRKILDRL
ncbi:DUF305 domain-containing protein [Streptomyces lateritius]|uniref:DUF305 domain-containing protein n=1 Tax=Streptomyces lateritius TaxID=67313 RepID=A0ABW6Y7S5_9ACTN